MDIILFNFLMIFILNVTNSAIVKENVKSFSAYNVKLLDQHIKIDGDWNKPQWKDIQAIKICNIMRDRSSYIPEVQAKIMYDDHNIYVIFHVMDRYVRCITKDINGPVWNDSAVEFFFLQTQVCP